MILGYLILYLAVGTIGLMYAIKFNKKHGKLLLETDGEWTSASLLTMILLLNIFWLPLVAFFAYDVGASMVRAWKVKIIRQRAERRLRAHRYL